MTNQGILSIYYLKEQRVNDAIGYYQALKKAYPNSEFMEDATRMQEELQQELQQGFNTFNTKS